MSKKITTSDLADFKISRKKWLMLTSYDSLTSSLFDELEIPVILVGDSAGQLVFGHDSTVPVTMEEMVPIVGGVARSNKHSLIVADMPFGSYQSSTELAIENATKFLKVGAHAVKLEGGQRISNTISSLVEAGIPVMGHIGLTPQSVNVFGGYKVQGKGEQAQSLLQDAKAIEASGAFSVVLEAIPRNLAKDITNSISIPTIGIGAGPDTDAQVLVWQDLAGLTKDPVPKFVKRYANLRKELSKAIMEVKNEVESGKYPDEKHLYQ
ncbi:MAG: 3-methyl-2-oxobutanoate hydroxymethyltransferase [Candidatus Nanopelagicales bacterium]